MVHGFLCLAGIEVAHYLTQLIKLFLRLDVPKQLQEIGFVCKRFRILPITSALERYARLRVQLERKGEPIDDFDLLIAATALTEDLTLVTHNLKHFERIEKLRTEDWDRMS